MRWIALPLVCVAAAGVAATVATARPEARQLLTATTGPTSPLATGLADELYRGPQKSLAYAMTRQAGATYVRLMVSWASIAPAKLPAGGFAQADPDSPFYDWRSLDASVSAAEANGLTPILDIVSTPSWAYSVPPGTWTGGSPKVSELGAFATALATHFDGSGPAPAAHVFSVWNEENYTKNLYPQSPTYYRSMVNAVADAVHAVDPADLVAAGELAPVKNAKGTTNRNRAIPPITWMRQMLCLSSTTPVHRTCSTQAKFDIWTHHPYSDTGPYGKAKVKGGVELGDLPEMYALLQTASRLGAISSAKPVQFWVTEVGWSSSPPNNAGVPMSLEARWVAETMYQIWKSGIPVATWFLLQDRPLGSPFQSGLYLRSSSLATARAKPLLVPFRFPFVAYLKPLGKVFVWGRDQTSDTRAVTIQEQSGPGGAWKTVAMITSNSYGIFQATLPLGANELMSLRASAPGSGFSRGFALAVPRNENLIVPPFKPN